MNQGVAPEIQEKEVRRELEFLAVIRTAFSSERSLIAWVRTSASLYTFGLSLTKFFDYLENLQGETIQWKGPRRLGFVLVCMGILTIGIAIFEYIKRFYKMRQQVSQFSLPLSGTMSLLPISAAVALLAIGFTTMIAVAMHR